jgi:Putative prokaryotic signal transducing protein
MGPMIKLLTVDSGFEAKLIAARLGADGIICELRGGVDGPYPIGAAHVYVPLDDLELARDLMAPVDFSDHELFGGEECDELDAEVD